MAFRFHKHFPLFDPNKMEHAKHMIRTMALTTVGSWTKGKEQKKKPTATTIRLKARKLYNSYERKYNTEIPSVIKRSLAPVSYFNYREAYKSFSSL